MTSDAPSMETKQIETIKMFNMTERPIMEYLCTVLDRQPEEMFRESMYVIPKESLTLYPIQEYNDNYIKISVETVDPDHVTVIPDELRSHPLINEALSFVVRAITIVYPLVMQENIQDEIKEYLSHQSLILEFDVKSLTFYPQYMYPPRRDEMLYNEQKSKIETFREECKQAGSTFDSFTPEEMAHMEAMYQNAIAKLAEVAYDHALADEEEKKNNEELNKWPRIAIVYKEVPYDDLSIDDKRSISMRKSLHQAAE
jgi:hypothetical protein